MTTDRTILGSDTGSSDRSAIAVGRMLGDNRMIIDRIWNDMGIVSPGFRLWVDFEAMERRVIPDGEMPVTATVD